MKNVILLFTTFVCFLLNGCNTGLGTVDDTVATVESNPSTSQIIVRASTGEITASNSTRSDTLGEIVFTGNAILWFNETTKELRFKDNMSIKPVVSNTMAISFYIGNEYLFTSMIYASSLSSQIFNSLVFYYNIIENKFFLTDGYPDVSVLSDPQKNQEERDENRENIASEWSKFIAQLKKEGRYKN